MERELTDLMDEEIDNKMIDELHNESTGGKGNASKAKKNGTFQKMGLSKPILSGILRMGYKLPTPIQKATVPIALSGKDVVAMARTGSGKTAAFLIPLLERMKEHVSSGGIRGIVLSPTRELAYQSYQVCKKLSHFTDIRSCVIVGGESIEQHFDEIAKNPDIVFATPGRLMHLLIEIPNFNLNSVQFISLILYGWINLLMICYDEADQLFELGFAPQLNEICRKLSTNHQSMLISATLPNILLEFSRAGLKDAEMVRLDTDNKLSPNLCNAFFIVRQEEKMGSLIYLLREVIPKPTGILVFVATRHHAEFVSTVLNLNSIKAAAIYGSMELSSRLYNLNQFKNNSIPILIVTDVAARGLDIPIVNTVIHYDCPSSPKLYVHRTGRTARGGKEGTAVVLVNTTETPYILDVLLYLGRSLESSTVAYSWEELTPDRVHYGRFPQLLLDNETHAVEQLIENNEDVYQLFVSMENSNELYQKTRAKASKSSKERSGSLDLTPIHPLLLNKVKKGELELEHAREEIKSYRPSNTIWEMERGKHMNDMMMKKRKMHQWSIEKTKEESKRAKEKELEETYLNAHEREDAEKDHLPEELIHPEVGKPQGKPQGKPHISKKMREMLKKSGKQINVRELVSSIEEKEREEKTYRDDHFYINPEMPISRATGEEFLGVEQDDVGKLTASVNNALFELMPDEAQSINSKRKIVRWDNKRKRYVRGTVGELKDNIHIRNESGQLIKSKSKVKRGELYEKWQNKHHIHEQRIGGNDNEVEIVKETGKRRRYGGSKEKKERVVDEVKSREQIAKDLKLKEKNKIKQMSKKDRQALLKQQGSANPMQRGGSRGPRGGSRGGRGGSRGGRGGPRGGRGGRGGPRGGRGRGRR